MFINIFKNRIRKLDSECETWVVEWTSRYGIYSHQTEQRYKAFTDEEKAKDFAESIRRANRLIGNTSQTRVTVTKQCSGPRQFMMWISKER